MRSRTRTARLSILFLILAIHLCSLEGKAIKRKHKHHVSHQKGRKRSEAFILKCDDHKYCINYRAYDCNQFWVKNNCAKMCKLCKSNEPEALKLPAVLYYKNGEKRSDVPAGDDKSASTRDVVFLSHMNDPEPTQSPPTMSVPLFDYTGNIRNWEFQFPKEHPVYAHAEGAKTWGDQPSTATANTPQQTQPTTQDQAAVAGAIPAAVPAAAPATASAPAPAVAAPVAAAAPATAAVAAPAVAAAAPVAATAAAPAVAAAPAAAAVAAPAVAAAASVATTAAAPAVAAAPAAVAYAGSTVAPSVAAPVTQAPSTTTAANTTAPAAAAPYAPVAAPAVAPVAAAPAATTAPTAVNTLTPAQNASVPAVAPAQPFSNLTAVPSPVAAANATAPAPVTSPVAQPQVAFNQSAQSFNPISNQTAGVQQVVGDQTAGAQQTDDKQADCKECPKMTKPPVVNHPFTVYCEDKWPSCAVGYSACNDTWWQLNCPKRCGVCKPDFSETNSSQSTSDNSQEGSEVYPNEVENLELPEDKIESDLVAPSAGSKPSVAKYTLRVKPKLRNGIPQIQEIRILPPHNKKGYTKPLMILKQNITKPMIENIEIDVPKKGAHLSSRPSVEVIEGKHKELLTVKKGQAILPDTSSQPETVQNTTNVGTTNTSQADQTQTNATASAYAPAPAPAPAPYTAPAADQPSYEAAAQPAAAAYSQYPAAQPAAEAYSQYPVAAQTEVSQTAGYGRSGVSTECSDHERCTTYPENMCQQHWLQRNCRKKCKICS